IPRICRYLILLHVFQPLKLFNMSKVSFLERKRNSTEITPSNIIVAETTTRQTGRTSRARTALMEVAPANQVSHSASDHPIAESKGHIYLPSFGRPDGPRQTGGGAIVYGLAIRLPSMKQELRYDPMTRKGRGTFKAIGTTGIQKKVRFAVPITRAEAGDLLELSRRLGREKSPSENSQQTQRLKANKDPEYKYFTDDGPIPDNSADEESLPDVDDYRVEETEAILEATPEFELDSNLGDKENLRPEWDDGLRTGALSGEFAVYDESAAGIPRAHQAQQFRRPLGELPVTGSQEPMGESEVDEARNSLHPIARQAENLRRAAAGEPPIRRSSLSREVMIIPDVYTDNHPASHAPPFSRIRAPSLDQSFSDHIYPLSRRPPNEGSDVTIPLPETDRSPRLVLQPPSDAETSQRTQTDTQ
ncbi:MAG: hypothetical protein Q9210_007479, partial [Variospora velana]